MKRENFEASLATRKVARTCMPTLSVIVTSYNYAQYVGTALSAVLGQSRAADEIIVVDDASTDNSVVVIRSLVKGQHCVRFIQNPINQGVVATANACLAEARGRYIYYACADDRVLPSFFEHSIDLLDRYPKTALCFSEPATFWDNSDIKPNRMRLSRTPRRFEPEGLVSERARRIFNIAHHTAPVRTEALRRAGGFLPELRWHSDWFAMWVMGFRHGACYIPKALAAQRTSPYTYSGAANRNPEDETQVYRAMLELLESPQYADVARSFQQSCVFSTYGMKMWRVISEHRRWSKYKTRGLFVQMLRNEWGRMLGARTPSVVKRVYRSVASMRECAATY